MIAKVFHIPHLFNECDLVMAYSFTKYIDRQE